MIIKNNFSDEEMNGIVEDTYKNIINECSKLIKNTNCSNEQIIALLSVIASNYAPISTENKNIK